MDATRTEAAASTFPLPADGPVVLVHDYLLVMRGAERTFSAIAACYPEATIATLLYDPIGTEGKFRHRKVRTSFLQPFAADQRRFRRFLPLFPAATGSLQLDGARVVISSSSAFAHGVRPAPEAIHVSYCHSPFRYVWHERQRAQQSLPLALRPLVRPMFDAIRSWDASASRRVSAYIANSELTRERIGDCYGRNAVVVNPPVEVDRFSGDPSAEDYFLVVGEVTAHKNVELALAAAERAAVKLTVVGDGPDLARLRHRFPRARFVGRVGDRRLTELYAGCRALVVPAVEEFGITMVEAQASGRPVLAAAAGGALEIVVDGETGALFTPGNVDELAEAMRAIDWEGFDVSRLRASSRRFSPSHFQRRFSSEVARLLGRGA